MLGKYCRFIKLEFEYKFYNFIGTYSQVLFHVLLFQINNKQLICWREILYTPYILFSYRMSHWLNAFGAVRWWDPRIQAAARQVYFHVMLFIMANISLVNWMNYIGFLCNIRKQISVFLFKTAWLYAVVTGRWRDLPIPAAAKQV